MFNATPYEGKKIVSLNYHGYAGFSHPDFETDSPTLVLAALHTVPLNSQDWFIGHQTCGGFSCNEITAAFLPLTIRPEIKLLLDRITNEVFFEESLDYKGFCKHGSEPDLAYKAYIEQYGLKFTSGLFQLTQALYPLDAIEENLEILTSDKINIASIDPNKTCGLVIFVVGDNCD